MAPLSDLIAAVRLDLADPDAEVFDDLVIRRAIERALVDLNTDLTTWYTLVDDGAGEEVQPEPSALHRDLLLLLAAAHLASRMRMQHAEAIKVSSSEMSADLTAAYKQWADTEVALRRRYQERLTRLRPELAGDVLTLGHEVTRYERGVEAEEVCS